MKATALAPIAKLTRTLEENITLAKAYIALADEAIAAEDYDAGERASLAGSAVARKAKDIPLIAKLENRAKECADSRSRGEKLKKAKETLLKNPQDPEANLLLGQYLCFQRGEWSSGLGHLAKGGDAALRDAAARDAANP